MKEVWKDIKGYEGLYQVSNLGNVKSLRKNRYLKINTYSEYDKVVLYKNKKASIFYIHRLVAENHIDNPNNYNCVNHKDENKRNNRIDNLEWCTRLYNCNYGKRNEKMSKTKSKYKIVQKDKSGNVIKIWQSIWELVHNTTYKKENIRHCCQNKYKYAYGYKWEYQNT